jgi:hypothetical protein
MPEPRDHEKSPSTLGRPRAGVLGYIRRLREGHWVDCHTFANLLETLHNDLVRTEQELASTQQALLVAHDRGGEAGEEPPPLTVVDTQSLALGPDKPGLRIHPDH